jgi:hypothetical protein
MRYLLIEDFKFGLDSRRFMLNSPAGTLTTFTNGHITPGGEIEKRKAFTNTALPTNCYGLEVTDAGLTVFGSVAEGSLNAALPDNVTYQRLQHPDGTTAMVSVVHSTVYAGKAFVIADFGAGGIISFYDEGVVDDLSPGKLATILADADALADYVSDQIDALDAFDATSSGGTVTVEGPTGQSFNVAVSNESTCTEPLDTDPPDVDGVEVTSFVITAFECQPPLASTELHFSFEEVPDGDYTDDTTITGISDSGTPFPIDLVDSLGSEVLLGGYEIGMHLVNLPLDDYTSLTLQGLITYSNGATKAVELDLTDFTGAAGDYEGYFTLAADPTEVTPTITTSVISDGTAPVLGTIPQTQFTVIAVKPAGTGKMTSVTIGGEEVLGTAATDLSGANYATTALLAAAIATQINTYCTANDKDFTAIDVGNIVVIRATDPASYATWSGDPVVVTVDDDICIGNGSLLFSRADAGTPPDWLAILADGIDILGATVNFNTDMTTSVQDVADQIKTYSGQYTAVASGASLFISKLVTSSDDAAIGLLVSGTLLNWIGNNPGGGNTGVNGGTFPGTLQTSTVESALRLEGTGNTAKLISNDIYVTAGGGLPPYTYQWEIVSGGTAIITGVAYDRRPYTFATSANAAITKIYVTPIIRYLSGVFNYVTKYDVQVRCKVTDSLSRIGYSDNIALHYP